MTEQIKSHEELKRKLLAEQNKEDIKKKNHTNEELKKILEIEQDEMLAKQKIHSSDSLEVSEGEKIKLIEVKELDDFKIGFHGEVKPCSGFIELHGSKGVNDTRIYLTFSHYKTLSHWEVNEQGNRVIIHDEKPSKITENYCLYCARERLINWEKVLINDYYEEKKKQKYFNW